MLLVFEAVVQLWRRSEGDRKPDPGKRERRLACGRLKHWGPQRIAGDLAVGEGGA